MDLHHLCLGCMSDKGTAAVCPKCGYQEESQPESPLHLAPGTILNGRYLLGRVLGHGGFGITYLGYDLNLHTKLAVKEYFPQNLATRAYGQTMISVFTGEAKGHFEYGMEKFIEEAQTLAQFDNHPGITAVRDFFGANGTAYLVMGYLEGVTLKEYLERKGGKIPFAVALKIMLPVLDALREIHIKGFLHRDISPENIYITSGGQVKLLDFGAARFAVGECSHSLSVILKTGYAPEEQYKTKGKQGPWTDVYAAAATMYRAITGQVPPEALERLDSDTLEPPSRLNVEISAEAEAALLKALAVKPGDRYQSVKEFQENLLSKETPYSANVDEGVKYIKCPACGTENRVAKTQTIDNLKCGKCLGWLKISDTPAISTTPPTNGNDKSVKRGKSRFWLSVAMLILLVIASAGWFNARLNLSVSGSNYSELQSKYNRLQKDYTKLESDHKNLKNSHSTLKTKYDKIESVLNQVANEVEPIISEIKLQNEDMYGNALSDGFTHSFDSEELEYVTFYLTLQNPLAGVRKLQGKLYVKFLNSWGQLIKGNWSPDGYTYEENLDIDDVQVIREGCKLNLGFFSSGTYKIEFWYNDQKIGQTSYEVY